MQLALIRHLPTEWNKRGVLQGKQDIDLLPVTEIHKQKIEQNKTIIEQLCPVDMILTSSLIRTQQTARHYGFSNFQIEPLLDELDFGEFEGIEKRRLIEKHGDKWFSNPKEIVLGESLLQFNERIYQFIERYKDLSSLLIFGHGSWIRAILSIHQVGSIDNMNRVEVENNKLIVINF